MFGERDESVTEADVPAVVENCVQEEPLFVLYCQISEVADDVAEILKPLAVILDVLKETVGAVRSMLSRFTVVDAVIVPMGTSE